MVVVVVVEWSGGPPKALRPVRNDFRVDTTPGHRAPDMRGGRERHLFLMPRRLAGFRGSCAPGASCVCLRRLPLSPPLSPTPLGPLPACLPQSRSQHLLAALVLLLVYVCVCV